MTTQSQSFPRFYVACLAAYNAGRLHGAWIDATDDADTVRVQIAAMLAASPEPDAEEWAIHDHEGFSPVSLSEWADIDIVCAMAAFIAEHGPLAAALIAELDQDVEAARRTLEDQYAGCFRSVAEFAQELTEDTSPPPAHLAAYIDYDTMARDMTLNGDVFSIETGFEVVHVFWGR